MAKPAQEPLQKPMIRNIIDDDAPTAASASTPIHRPTIAASMMRYSCCNMYPKTRGMAKRRISFVGDPTVISLIFGMVRRINPWRGCRWGGLLLYLLHYLPAAKGKVLAVGLNVVEQQEGFAEQHVTERSILV